MTIEAKIQITSTELGRLWMTYQIKSAMIILFGQFRNSIVDVEAKGILDASIIEDQKVISEIIKIFNNQNVIIPIAFDEKDTYKDAPALFDDIFNIMFLRQISKINLGLSSFYLVTSYMKEVQDLFDLNYMVAKEFYVSTTNYLLNKGVLAKAPYVTVPNKVEFIEERKYVSAFKIFTDKRALNTVEIGYIYESIEDNILGMQLTTGFAQVAQASEVKEFFIDGKELSKKIITNLTNVCLNSDIQPPSTWSGKATAAIQPAFSDKLMMFVVDLISNFAIGNNSLGTSFSMRSDLPLIFTEISKDLFFHSKKGGKLMIRHMWMEEPPQMEDRNQLTKFKK
ncbi:DUF3231 family protein [Clostridium sp.]|uniref:DUF3231 family protein n=1 Tax=Clostridium sp. TaxID=1506 RepID=UPI001A5BB4C1|nr:DUF3231 family protein [Clostridium sp.]MBK5237426.1 DUF3231 family protein [Clostridium sp.]